MRHIPDLSTFRRAGRRRARTASDLISFLHTMEDRDLSAVLNIMRAPAMKGGAEQIAQLIASPAALTTGSVVLTAGGATCNVIGIPEAPLVLGLGYVGNTTTIATTQSVTYSLNRSDTPAVIGSCVITNPGAGTSAIGPALALAVVPFGIPAASGVTLSGLGSAAGPVPVGSATAPIVLAVIGLY